MSDVIDDPATWAASLKQQCTEARTASNEQREHWAKETTEKRVILGEGRVVERPVRVDPAHQGKRQLQFLRVHCVRNKIEMVIEYLVRSKTDLLLCDCPREWEGLMNHPWHRHRAMLEAAGWQVWKKEMVWRTK